MRLLPLLLALLLALFGLAACAHRPRHVPILTGPVTLVAKRPFALPDGEKQVARHHLGVPQFGNGQVFLALEILGGADDEGRRGLTVRLYDPHGVKLLDEIIASPGGEPWRLELPLREGGDYILRLVDLHGLIASERQADVGWVGAEVHP